MPEDSTPPDASRSLDLPTTTASKLRTRKIQQVPEGMNPKVWREQRDKAWAAARAAGLVKAQAILKLKREAKAMVRRKVELGQPITAEEERQVRWSQAESTKHKEERLINEVSKLVIKPQTVEALRLVVERTAAKHSYNPIEELIKLTGPDSDLPDKEKVVIHKALLPFLVPVMPAVKQETQADDGKRVRVTVTQFVFPGRSPAVAPFHAERPVSQIENADITAATPSPSTTTVP